MMGIASERSRLLHSKFLLYFHAPPEKVSEVDPPAETPSAQRILTARKFTIIEAEFLLVRTFWLSSKI